MKYAELLPTRIPEYLEGDNNLKEYLEVVGDMFDEIDDDLDTFANLKDYKTSPESRLAVIARNFALNPARPLPERIMRGIVRDLNRVYTSAGTIGSIKWIFRLLGWTVQLNEAWLLNPERYDPRIIQVYSDYYEREGLPTSGSSLTQFMPRLGQPYVMGETDQEWNEDPSFIVEGYLQMGRNDIRSLVGDEEAFSPYSQYTPDTSFDQIDFRNFVYGEARDEVDGTFFYGRTALASEEHLRKIRIIPEKYPDDAVRTQDRVIKTPYIFIEIDSQDYEQFTQPYVADDGTVYEYTTRERFEAAKTLLNYFLNETIRPANVTFVLIASVFIEEDPIYFSEEIKWDITHEDELYEDSIQSNDVETHEVDLGDDAYTPALGDDGLYLGMPTYLPVNTYSGTDMADMGETIDTFEYSLQTSTYSINGQSMDFVQDGSEYVYSYISLRYPWDLEVTSDVDLDYYVRASTDMNFVMEGTLPAGTNNLANEDWVHIEFRAASNPTASFALNWYDQSN